MSGLACITNTGIPGIRKCVVRGAHSVNCPKDDGAECDGCQPKAASVGLLCRGCWERVEAALARWEEFSTVVSGIERAVQRDNGGVRTAADGYVPIPATRLAVDECWSFLRGAPASAELWVSTPDGAASAVQFTRAAEAAYRTHEIEERPHRVRRVRCPKCGQLNLIWNPTPYFGAHVTVTCGHEGAPGCGAELDQTSFEKVAEIEESRSKRA